MKIPECLHKLYEYVYTPKPQPRSCKPVDIKMNELAIIRFNQKMQIIMMIKNG